MLWYVLSCLGDGVYKISFAANQKEKPSYVVQAAGFHSCYLRCSKPNKMF